MKRAIFRTSTSFALLGATLASCGDDEPTTPPKPRTAVMVRVWTDMGVPKDIDTVRATVYQEGIEGLVHDREVTLGTSARESWLPVTLAIVPGSRKNPRVTVEVRGLRGHGEVEVGPPWTTTFILPDGWEEVLETNLRAQTSPPEQGPTPQARASVPAATKDDFVDPPVARLDMKMDALCTGADAPACAPGSTCSRGKCALNKTFAEFPLLRKSDLPSSSSASGGGCFEVSRCFEVSTPLTDPVEACTFDMPEGEGDPNVALELPSDTLGYCDDTRCRLVLDLGSDYEVIAVQQGRVALDPDYCELAETQKVQRLVISRGPCSSKIPADAFCEAPADGGSGGVSGAGGGGSGVGGQSGQGGMGGAGGATDGMVLTQEPPYVLPADGTGVIVRPLLTVGDAVNAPNGSEYVFSDAPTAVGAVDDSGENSTLLVTHFLGSDHLAVHAHGASGGFVSRWTADELLVQSGEDLGRGTRSWDSVNNVYSQPEPGVGFEYLRAGTLVDGSALYDDASGAGYPSPLYLTGEQNGAESRALAFALDRDIWDLPALGRFSRASFAANPTTGATTLVAQTEDTPGRVYFYAGPKSTSGDPVLMAGLRGGTLFGLRFLLDIDSDIQRFELEDLGDVTTISGDALDARAAKAQVTAFEALSGCAWNPANGNELYFVANASRLWRLNFVNAKQPELGGTADLLVSDGEGNVGLDGIAIDALGRIYLTERPGDDAHLARVLRYDVERDTLTALAHADASFFDPNQGSLTFVAQNEDITGISDASKALGPGWFLFTLTAPGENAGQLLALFDPAGI